VAVAVVAPAVAEAAVAPPVVAEAVTFGSTVLHWHELPPREWRHWVGEG